MFKKSLPPLDRRSLLCAVGALGFGAAYAGSAGGFLVDSKPTYQDFWRTSRQIVLYRPETGEAGRFEYWANGRIQMPAWSALQVLLRDVRANVAMEIDVGVVDLVWAVQQWVYRDSGRLRVFRATDGARTEHTNATTRGAAPNSTHKDGRAIDGRLEGLGLAQYARAARFFGVGGVGLYSAHVHVDTAAVRKWGF